MFTSPKASKARSFSTGSSTAQLVITAKINCQFLSSGASGHRAFSWGTKSKWGSTHAGKLYKGFYTRYADAQRRNNKHASITALDRHLLNIRRSRSSSSFRSASSWKKPDDFERSSSRKRHIEKEEGEDWYSRWERLKRQQYEEFVKKVEQDPYQALFGASNKWLGWLDSHVSGTREPIPSQPSEATKTPASEGEKIRQEAPSLKKSTATTSTVRTSGDNTRSDARRTTVGTAVVGEQEYEIDPITLHKVSKQLGRPELGIDSSTQTIEKAINIPVKIFKPSPVRNQSDQPSRAEDSLNQKAQTTKGGLTHEGFDNGRTSSSAPAQLAQHNSFSAGRQVFSKIESALDRHIKGEDAKTPEAKSGISHYQPEEVRQDDVDLLRASDVRASAGLKGRQVRETDAEKRIRQRALEDQYEKRPTELEDRLAQEMASSGKTKQDNIVSYSNIVSEAEAPASVSSASTTELSSKTAWPQTDSVLTSGQVGKIRAKLVPLKTKIDSLKEDYAALRQQLLEEKRRIQEAAKKKADKKACELLDQEVKTQKEAMQAMEMHRSRESGDEPAPSVAHEELHGEGDMASNVHEFAGRARWYKRKAPHAQCEIDAKLQRLANEKAFVREIRCIYEETYGTIDINHRQPSSLEQGARDSSAITETPACRSVQDARLVNLVSDDEESAWKSTGLDANYLVAIEKELSAELRSLLSAMENCKHRASGESNEQKLDAIHKELCRTAEQCSRKLVLAGRKIRSVIDDAQLVGSDSAASFSSPDSTVPQNASTSQATSSPPQLTTYYRILAYDNSAQKVNSARTSSQTPFVEEKPLTPLQALNMLNNPGKFLPHLMTLHNKGYEIVSGANNILVLKKVRDAVETKDDYSNRPNPIDGTTTPEVSTGNFASPTGFVNHNPVIQPEELERQQPSPALPTDKVRRQEDVFSGQSRRNWQIGKRMTKRDKRKARRKKTLKRMLITGTLTAAACYATGLIVEMIHT
ncbi:MAG: hypothetical protein Q9217_003073 [Psora testacea]